MKQSSYHWATLDAQWMKLKMYKIIQESNLLLSLLFLTELKLFPGLKLEFLEAFFNSLQGYYYSRASLLNNKSCLELKKTSRKLHFNPGNSFRSVKNSSESNKVLFITVFDDTYKLEWVNEWWHVGHFVCNFCDYSPYYCSRWHQLAWNFDRYFLFQKLVPFSSLILTYSIRILKILNIKHNLLVKYPQNISICWEYSQA